MKKLLKLWFTRILIIYVIIYILLGSTGQVFATRGYDSACGEYVSQYARDYVSTYVKIFQSGTWKDCYNNRYNNTSAAIPSKWFEDNDAKIASDEGEGIWHVCCTTGIEQMYKQALGIDLTSYGWSRGCDITITAINNGGSTLNKNFIVITDESQLQPGDILCNSSHNEMYVGNREHFNSGNGGGVRQPRGESVVSISHRDHSFTSEGGSFDCAIRLKDTVQVDPSGKVTGVGTATSSDGLVPSDFFFNGIPNGRYSLATKMGFFEWLINALKALLNYIIGLIAYLIRGVIIAFVSIFDRELNQTIESIATSTPKSLEEFGVTATNADDPDSINRAVTIQGLVFNDIRLFDVNIFEK